MSAMQMGGISCSRCTASGQIWTVFRTACWRLLQSGPQEYWPLEWVKPWVESDGGWICVSVNKRPRIVSWKVATLDHATSTVFWCEIFIEDYSRLLLLGIMSEMIFAIMTRVVQARYVLDPINKKSRSLAKTFYKKVFDTQCFSIPEVRPMN